MPNQRRSKQRKKKEIEVGEAQRLETDLVDSASQGTEVIAALMIVGDVVHAPEVGERRSQQDRHTSGLEDPPDLSEKSLVVLHVLNDPDRADQIEGVRIEWQLRRIGEHQVGKPAFSTELQHFLGVVEPPDFPPSSFELLSQRSCAAAD